MRYKLWNKKENSILKENYMNMTSLQLQKCFYPYRTLKSIERKRQELKLFKREQSFFWSKDEISYLKKNYGKTSTLKIAESLKKTITSIYSKGESMGLTIKKLTYMPKRYKDYSEEEDKILKENYGKLKSKDIQGKLPRFRTKISIRHRARRLGLSSELYSNSKEDNGMYGKRHTKKIINQEKKRKKKLWQNPKYAKKMFKAFKLKPSIPERQVLQIIKKNKFPFNYVGDGKVWIKRYNPDFLSKNPKHIIEVNGEYWHKDKNKERRKKYAYLSLGYKMLVIWQRELKNPQKVTEKIVNFLIR